MGLGRQEGFVAGAFVVGGFDENFGEGGAVELSFDVGAVNVHGAALRLNCSAISRVVRPPPMA